jgi:hypothetical protein
MQRGTTFTFVTGGPAAALERARHAADGRNVVASGGGSTARQYLAASLLDELDIHLVLALPEVGLRLFDSPALARPAAPFPPPRSPPTNASGPTASRNTDQPYRRTGAHE